MRAALPAAALLLLVVALAPPQQAGAQASRSGSGGEAGLANEQGWDIDRILRRARELDAQTRAVLADDRHYQDWSRRVERAGGKAVDTARSRESEARRRHDAEAAAQRLDSMHHPSVPKSEGERLRDQETLSRLRDEAERARRAADDEIPLMWRGRR